MNAADTLPFPAEKLTNNYGTSPPVARLLSMLRAVDFEQTSRIHSRVAG